MKQMLLPYIFIFTFITVNATGQTFHKIFDGTNDEWGFAGQQTADGGYIITGYTSSFGAGSRDVLLIKTDSNGVVIWTKTYGDTLLDEGISVQQTYDGGYIVIGHTFSFGAGGPDIYLIKTDANGDTLWTKTIGGINNEYVSSGHQTTDGGYIISGLTGSFGAGELDVYLVKTDSLGDVLWTKTYGETGDDRGRSVQQTADGGYILTGGTNSFGTGSSDVFLIKTDDIGNIVWAKTYASSSGDEGGSVVLQTSDNGYIILGSLFLIKTNSTGDIIWAKFYYIEDAFAFTFHGSSLELTDAGGYIVSGGWEDLNGSTNLVYLIETDANGNANWSKIYYGSPWLNSMAKTKDEGYIIVGEVSGAGVDWSAINLIKTNKFGISGCNELDVVTIAGNFAIIASAITPIVNSGGTVNNTSTIVNNIPSFDSTLCYSVSLPEEFREASNIKLHPNPTTGKFTLTMAGGSVSHAQLFIYNVLAEIIHQSKVTKPQSEIDISNHPKGIYFVKVISGDEVFVGKIVYQ